MSSSLHNDQTYLLNIRLNFRLNEFASDKGPNLYVLLKARSHHHRRM